jgi:hypothetical protein
VHDEPPLDGQARLNLATFVTSWDAIVRPGHLVTRTGRYLFGMGGHPPVEGCNRAA